MPAAARATLADARAIVADVGDRIRLMVHENWRFRPYYRQIAAWRHESTIGKPYAFQMETLVAGLVRPPDGGEPPGLVRQPFFAGLERLIV